MLAAATAIASCYAPDLRDCKVTCARSVDCASGQVCGADHFCAAPDVAGTCGVPTDAPAIDARAIDARPIDAPTTVALAIDIMGPGSVALDGVGSCSMSCTLLAPIGMPATLRASPKPKNMFDRWTTPTCAGQPATCTFMAVAPVSIGAHFVKADP